MPFYTVKQFTSLKVNKGVNRSTPLFSFKGVHYFTVHERSSWLSNTRSASLLSFSLSCLFCLFLSEGKDARADICSFMHSVSRVTSTYVPDYAVYYIFPRSCALRASSPSTRHDRHHAMCRKRCKSKGSWWLLLLLRLRFCIRSSIGGETHLLSFDLWRFEIAYSERREGSGCCE